MKNDIILGLLHRVVGITRRSAMGSCQRQPDAPPREAFPPCNPEAARSFRERGRILVCLEQGDGITQKQLAEKIDIRPQSLSELLVKLEQDGMIERRPDDSDKRAILVYLSDFGRKRLDAIKAERERFATEFLSPLSEEDKETLAAILQKLLDAHKRCDKKD